MPTSPQPDFDQISLSAYADYQESMLCRLMPTSRKICLSAYSDGLSRGLRCVRRYSTRYGVAVARILCSLVDGGQHLFLWWWMVAFYIYIYIFIICRDRSDVDFEKGDLIRSC